MALTRIRALIFDFDGLLVDTEGPAYQSWLELFETHTCSLTLDEWSMAIGGAGIDFCAVLQERSGRSLDTERLRAHRNRRKHELASRQPLLPGVLDYLDASAERGLRLAVASSSPRAWVEAHLVRLGILERFGCVICSEDVAEVKPSPELYLKALSTLNVHPDEAVAFEDSPNGITAAKRAGLICVAVPNALTRALPIAHADLRLESLADLPLSRLLDRMTTAATSAKRAGI